VSLVKILRKNGRAFEILALPGDADLSIGEYVVAREGDKALILEVIDVDYADIPGLMEDMLRELALQGVESAVYDPHKVASITLKMREAKVIVAKLRAVVSQGLMSQGSLWLPPRYSSRIERVKPSGVLSLVRRGMTASIELGNSFGERFSIDGADLDGSLTIITGRKGTGKSHLAKLLVYELVKGGCYAVVLDVNGEYVGLGTDPRGGGSEIEGRLTVLRPSVNFRAGLNTIGLEVFADILEHVYATPPASLRELARIWESLARAGSLTPINLLGEVRRAHMNEAIRDALLSRLHSIFGTGFFTDDDEDPLAEILASSAEGALLVIDLSRLRPGFRRTVIEYVLSRLTRLLHDSLIQPLFLVSEEAHLYVGNTYWEDIVTRMRHLGISPVIVTNQPDSIPEMVYRQADNLFLFNFLNETDLESLSRYSHIDAETVKKIAPSLEIGQCLVAGRVVGGLPMPVQVRELQANPLGATKRFFNRDRERDRVVVRAGLGGFGHQSSSETVAAGGTEEQVQGGGGGDR
jgi:hypothetical protein